MQIEMTEHRN